MVKVESFSISYRPEEDAGQIHLALADGSGADLPIDSPAEASFMWNFLRTEDVIYYDPSHRLIVSGMEGVGEDKA
jgi:hypothetical protein